MRAVVVAGDGARADIHPCANGRVAQVSEMIGFRPRPECRLFQLHEISDFGSFPNHRFRPQMGKGADRRALCNTRTDDEAEVVDDRTIGDFRPDNADMALDFAGCPDAALSLNRHTGMYYRVGAHLHIGIDVGCGRVDDRDAGGHQFFVLRLSHKATHFRELRAAVDAPDLLRVVDNERFHRQLAAPVDAYQVGQVELALGVL